jgi:hypothetical protein
LVHFGDELAEMEFSFGSRKLLESQRETREFVHEAADLIEIVGPVLFDF